VSDTLAYSTGTLAPDSDEALLERFLEGDDTAYTTLYQRYDRGVLTYLRTIMRDRREVADDLFQETFVKLFRERTRYRAGQEGTEAYSPIKNFRGWLFRVAHNLAISHLRAAKIVHSINEDEETHRWDERLMVTVEESYASIYGEGTERRNEMLYEKLRSCLDLLPQALRDVYVLREVNGMEYEEVASALDISQEAARMRLSRARRALRSALEQYIDTE